MNRITIYDVAKKTGYSIATVNRALSNKSRISQKTRDFIVHAAQEMGYKPSKAAAGISRAQIQIGVVIRNAIQAFVDEILSGIESSFEQLEDFNVSGEIYVSSSADAQDMLEKIRDMVDRGFNAILILPPENDAGFEQLIQEIAQKKVVTATVVSDLPGAAFSVRNNGILSGSLAAEMLCMLAPGKKTAIVTASKEKTVHKDTITGFYRFADAHGMDVAGIYEHNDSPEAAYQLVDRILRENPDIGGVYLGSANSSTFCKRVVELGCERRLKIVASDVFDELTAFLKEDVIQATIFQNPYNQGRLAVRYLYEYIVEGRKLDDTVFLLPQLVVKSNIDYITNS